MKMLKLFFILAIFLSPQLGAKTTDSLILRGIVPPQFSINQKSLSSSAHSQNLLVFNGNSNQFKVRKVKLKNQTYLEVTFH